MKRSLIYAALLLATRTFAAEPVFDMHVHLRDYETSLLKYETEVRESGIQLSSIGVMWFGGPNQALAAPYRSTPTIVEAGGEGECRGVSKVTICDLKIQRESHT